MKRESVKQSLMEHKLGFDLLMERLKKALSASSDAELAQALGMSSSNLSNRKKIGSVPFDIIVSLCISRNISTEWLFRGVGSVFIEGEQVELEPVAAVDPKLLGRIVRDLEVAFSGEQAESEKIHHSIQLSLLAAGIYNSVAFMKNEKLRNAAIKVTAEEYANAAKILRTEIVG